MHRITYLIPVADKDAELEWLREVKVFPAVQRYWDFDNDKEVYLIGAIVDDETVISIKLKRKLRSQDRYLK
jgi:hypothetical protein